jgi:hypothetical protein
MGFIGAMLKRIHAPRQVNDKLSDGNGVAVQKLVEWWSGARYRVRTCDPYSVNVVLYH